MFSLIITIISIALVALLALATLYYGGDAFNQGRADAKAAQILSHGQQLMAAADLYFVNHGVFPPTKQAMVDGGYLDAIPVAQGEAVGSAWAEDEEWVLPLPGVPVFVLPATAAQPCQRVNFRSMHMDGILAEINESIAAQCYGPTDSFKTVVAKSGVHLAALSAAVAASDPTLDPTVALTPADFGATETALPDPTDETGTWTSLPGATLADSGGSSGGGSGSSLPPNMCVVDPELPPEPCAWNDAVFWNETSGEYADTAVFMAVGQSNGWTSDVTVGLHNETGAPFTIQSIGLSDTGLGFSLSHGCVGMGAELPVGGACHITVTFAPSTTPNESRYVTLTVETTAGPQSTEIEGYINPVE